MRPSISKPPAPSHCKALQAVQESIKYCLDAVQIVRTGLNERLHLPVVRVPGVQAVEHHLQLGLGGVGRNVRGAVPRIITERKISLK